MGLAEFTIKLEELLFHRYSIAMAGGILPLLFYGNDMGTLWSVTKL